MTIASAPGGVFLFGEHAVVYGYSALAAAIDRRATVRVERRQESRIRIDSKGVGKLAGNLSRSREGWRIRIQRDDAKFAYALKALELTFDELETASGLDIRIISAIPIGSGISSSSAVIVATVAATAATLGRELPLERILELAFKAELAVQGFASKTGVGVATYGGFLGIRRGKVNSLRGIPEMRLVIGDTGKSISTGAMVRKVAKLRKNNPLVADSLFEIIGQITEAGVEAIRERDLERVGAMMNLNQASLAALGISPKELERLIVTAREAGALGAKLTGAGGGGCMIALAPKKDEAVAKAIRAAGGQQIMADIGGKGLRFKNTRRWPHGQKL